MKQKVLVTGATRGIGRAIAARLLQEGHDVYGTGTQNSAERCADLADLAGVNWLDVDFSNRDSVRDFLRMLAELGPFARLARQVDGHNRMGS